MLVITRKLHQSVRIDDHITVSVEAIKGNTVRIGIDAPPWVPILREELVIEDTPGSAKEETPREDQLVLVVDDSEADREYVRRRLADSPYSRYRIAEAGTVGEGLEKCHSEKPSCVLLDYRLPDETGMRFLESARAAGTWPLSVVMMTGVGDELLAAQAIRKGARNYIPKNRLRDELFYEVVHEAVLAGRRDSAC